MIAKSAGSEADAVVLDLEDSVPIPEKEKAREQVREGLASVDFKNKERLVRINGVSTEFAHQDIVCAVESRVDGIVIPKVESIDDVIFVERIAGEQEKQRNTPGITTLQAMIESANGIKSVNQISTATSRLTALIFGSADYAASIGARPNEQNQAIIFLYTRSRIIIAAAAAGIDALDSVYVRFNDTEGLTSEALDAFAMGFTGKWVIHPKQVSVVNQCFTPSQDEFQKARKMILAYEEAKSRGAGAITIDGEMVDEASVLSARKLMDMAKTLGIWEQSE
jgi:citrate lyase beta subunit